MSNIWWTFLTEDVAYIVQMPGSNGPSITNDAERIVARLWWEHRRPHVVYRDTMGNWDEILHEEGCFKGLASWKGPVPEERIARYFRMLCEDRGL